MVNLAAQTSDSHRSIFTGVVRLRFAPLRMTGDNPGYFAGSGVGFRFGYGGTGGKS